MLKRILLIGLTILNIDVAGQTLNKAANRIPAEDIFKYFVNSTVTNLQTGKNVTPDIANSDKLVINYIQDIKEIDLSSLDEFDRKRLLATYKDTISAMLGNADFNKTYTSMIKVQWLGTYDFTNKRIPCELGYDFSQGFYANASYGNETEASSSEKLYGLNILYTNVEQGTEGIYMYLDENKAEKVIKALNNGDVYGIAVIKHVKFLPIAFVSETKDYQSAKLLKLDFHYLLKEENGTVHLGDKITELQWPDKQYSHLNLR